MRGGKRPGSGRKKLGQNEHTTSLILNAIRQIKSNDELTDEQTKIELIKEVAGVKGGMLYLAQMVFGKPKEKLEIDNITEIVVRWEDQPKMLKVG